MVMVRASLQHTKTLLLSPGCATTDNALTAAYDGADEEATCGLVMKANF